MNRAAGRVCVFGQEPLLLLRVLRIVRAKGAPSLFVVLADQKGARNVLCAARGCLLPRSPPFRSLRVASCGTDDGEMGSRSPGCWLRNFID